MSPRAVPLTIDRASARPLPQQVADALRRAIVDGVLVTGDRLPSTRALAAELRVSRGVAHHAYDQLAAEGWIEGRTGSGTYVAAEVSVVPRTALVGPTTPTDDGGLPTLALRPGIPWTPPRASAAWRRAWRIAGSEPAPHD